MMHCELCACLATMRPLVYVVYCSWSLGHIALCQQVTESAPSDDDEWRTGSDCGSAGADLIDGFGGVDTETCNDEEGVDLTTTCCGCSNFDPNGNCGLAGLHCLRCDYGAKDESGQTLPEKYCPDTCAITWWNWRTGFEFFDEPLLTVGYAQIPRWQCGLAIVLIYLVLGLSCAPWLFWPCKLACKCIPGCDVDKKVSSSDSSSSDDDRRRRARRRRAAGASKGRDRGRGSEHLGQGLSQQSDQRNHIGADKMRGRDRIQIQQPSDQIDMAPGTLVQTYGLISEAGSKMNGATGTILGYDRGTGRYIVNLQLLRGLEKQIKPANLRQLRGPMGSSGAGGNRTHIATGSGADITPDNFMSMFAGEAGQTSQPSQKRPPEEGDWAEKYDTTHNAAYYVHRRTGETTWERPAELDSAGTTLSNDQTKPSKPAAAAGNAAAALQATPTEASSRWVEKMDPKSGRPYYVHRDTGETTWINPAAAGNAPSLVGPISPSMQASSGWVENMEPESGRPYYVHRDTGETTWINPEAATDATAARDGAPSSEELHAYSRWVQKVDPNSGHPYYVHSDTGETSWTSPDASSALEL